MGRNLLEIPLYRAGKKWRYIGRRVWKDIQIGDTLFAPDGSITKVIDIPFDEEHDVYKMTLQDGRSVYTTLEHLWKINKNGENWNKLYTTEEK